MSYSKSHLTITQIAAALAPFGVQLGSRQSEQLREYICLLLKWNQRLSLTAVTDPMEVLTRHFGESMFAAQFLDFSRGRLADAGSGAGFPGLALKVVNPELEVVLIESNVKKCAFLKEVIRALQLTATSVFDVRLESFQAERGSFDFVTARAVGQFEHLLQFAARLLGPKGSLVLWVGGEAAESLAEDPSWSWRQMPRIPGSERRFVLIGEPAGR